MAGIKSIIDAIPTRAESRKGFQPREKRSNPGGKVKNSVWLSNEVDDRLHELARARNTSKQQLFLAGLDLLFRELGEPSIAELERKASQ